MSLAARVEPYGDAAFRITLGTGGSPQVAARVRALADAVAALGIAGLGEGVPGYATLTVGYDPLATPAEAVRGALARAVALAPSTPAVPTRSVVVPVVYGGADGPDLASVAADAGLSEREVVRRHAGRPYRVYFLGFAPGFAYMGDVDPVIAAPRLAAPRRSVPPGSVGVAGPQTGVYPRATPGGWRLLGRTPLVVYDPARPEPALFRQGDEVIFVPAPAPATPDREEPRGDAPAADPEGEPALRVLHPGLFTTLQDLGRDGHQAAGVPAAGAADPVAARLANRLAGNPDGAAVLELTALGPQLAAVRDLALSLCGGDLGAAADGVALATGSSFVLRKGAVLRFAGPRAGCRAYLAVAGGFAARPVLGSRAADPLGGLGPRPLRGGDVLRAYPAPAPPASLAGRRLAHGAYAAPAPGETLAVGVLPGPQARWFAPGWLDATHATLSASDRVGLRLAGRVARADGEQGELLSEGNVLGAVQVPPDGGPVVLLAGRPTVGGYPKPGVVCTADAWRLAQVLPGAGRVRLQPVDLAWAHRRLRAVAALLADRGLIREG